MFTQFIANTRVILITPIFLSGQNAGVNNKQNLYLQNIYILVHTKIHMFKQNNL